MLNQSNYKFLIISWQFLRSLLSYQTKKEIYFAFLTYSVDNSEFLTQLVNIFFLIFWWFCQVIISAFLICSVGLQIPTGQLIQDFMIEKQKYCDMIQGRYLEEYERSLYRVNPPYSIVMTLRTLKTTMSSLNLQWRKTYETEQYTKLIVQAYIRYIIYLFIFKLKNHNNYRKYSHSHCMFPYTNDIITHTNIREVFLLLQNKNYAVIILIT